MPSLCFSVDEHRGRWFRKIESWILVVRIGRSRQSLSRRGVHLWLGLWLRLWLRLQLRHWSSEYWSGGGAVCDARAQHFLQTANAITAMRMVAPNMAIGKENRQWSAEKGFWTMSSRLSNWLASKLPLMCFLRSVIIAVSCLLSLWLKSCDRDIVQSSQELTISVSSDSSVEMRWSIVGM
jgi:hypothetical protein